MWDLVLTGFDGKDTGKIDVYLADGYEPFSVIQDSYVGYIICLKKEVDEIHSKQGDVKGTSRRATGKPKTKDSS